MKVCYFGILLFTPAVLMAQHEACGAIINTSYNGVEARSNGIYTGGHIGDNPSCDPDGSLTHLPTTYGELFQCIEFVKRFYAALDPARFGPGAPFDSSLWYGNANSYYYGTSKGGIDAATKGLIRIANDGRSMPVPGDLVVFDKPGTVGHVAIVNSVSANQVEVIEQNWSDSGKGFLQVDPVTGRLKRVNSLYEVLGWLRDGASQAACPPNFEDTFTRPDGTVGNGWANTSGNVNGSLVLTNGTLSTTGTDGEAGIYRAIDLSQQVTVSATLTQESGFSGLLDRYNAGFRFGSDGSISAGYGVNFHRGDQTFTDSSVALVLNGVTLASLPSTFQFGASIDTAVTFNPDGSITGSVTEGENFFSFSFEPRSISAAGGNLSILVGFADSRSTVITNPTVDNLAIVYACNGVILTHNEGSPDTVFANEVPNFLPPRNASLTGMRIYLGISQDHENDKVEWVLWDGFASAPLACQTSTKTFAEWGAGVVDYSEFPNYSSGRGNLVTVTGFTGPQCQLRPDRQYLIHVGNSDTGGESSLGGYLDGTVFFALLGN